VSPEFILLNIHFLSFRIFEQLTLALKFFTVLKYFFVQDFWATCTCLENRVCPKIFQAGRAGGLPPPSAPFLVRLWLPFSCSDGRCLE